MDLLDRAMQERLSAAATTVDSPVEITVGVDAASSRIADSPGPVVVVTSDRARRGPTAARLLASVPPEAIWPEAHAHPGPALIDRATAELRSRRPGTVIGLGGGSVLDLTKIAAAPLRERGETRLIQIPTTAGTGADVTRWGTYWLPDGTKQSFDEPAGFADHALIVSELTASMPPRLTLATGLDTFVHSAEAIVGRRATPASSALAAEAISLVARSLAPAIVDPTPEHRAALAEAATLAGLALSVTRSAAAHALSYSLTGVYGLEHGLAVGLMWRGLLPELARQSTDAIATVFDALEVDSVAAAETRIDDWFAAVGLVPSLAALGLPAEAGRDTVEQAVNSNRLENQPGEWGRPQLDAAIARVA